MRERGAFSPFGRARLGSFAPGSLPRRPVCFGDLLPLSATGGREKLALLLLSVALRRARMVDLPLVSAPDARAYFFLLRQEKVAKKKATPGSAPGCAGYPALLEGPGGWLNSPSAQTTPADTPRPLCVARRGTWGPGQPPQRDGKRMEKNCRGRPEKNGKNQSPSANQRPQDQKYSLSVSHATFLRALSVALLRVWRVDLPLVSLWLRQAWSVDLRLASAADRRAYFLLLRQKKVAKEKATPGSAPGDAGFPALLEGPGGWLNSPSAQTTPADCPRPLCVARRGTWEPGQPPQRDGKRMEMNCRGRPEKMGKNQSPSANQRPQHQKFSLSVSPATSFRAPCEALSSAGCAGEVGLPCLSRRRVLASRPRWRAAQGTGLRPAPTQGCLFLWLLSFGQTKESTPARQARKPALNQPSTSTAKARIAAVKQRSTPARQARKPAAIEQTTPAAKARKPALTHQTTPATKASNPAPKAGPPTNRHPAS